MMSSRFLQGVEFFNRARYFDAHEAWEDEWRESSDPERRWLQGLVQVAVALHHQSVGNTVGSASVLARAIKNLKDCPAALRGIDITELRKDLDRARAEIGGEVHPVQIISSRII